MTAKNTYFDTHQSRRLLLQTVLALPPGKHHLLINRDNKLFITDMQTGDIVGEFFWGAINGYHGDDKII